MKNLIPQRAESGSVLLIGLVTCALLGLGLASYLVLTQSQHVSVIRSQGWNSAMPIAEAGAEEALAHLNRGVPYFDARDSTNNLATNGWVYNSSTGRYHSPRRYLGQDYYESAIQLVSGIPLIRSTGFVFMASSYGYAPQSFFATVGVDQSASYRPRKVRVETKTDPLFNVAMAALRQIDFNGKNVATDSFDSADPNYSNNGLYPSGNVNKTKANGDVVTDYTIINSLSVGNASIKGQVKTGPNGTITIGPNGSVGDRAWVEGGNTGIQPGRSADDMNVAFPDVILPGGSWLPGSSGNTTIDGITYDYVFNNPGTYMYTISSFNKGIYVGSNVTVRLKVTSSVNMNGSSDTIRIASSGKLTMFMVGSSFKIAGNGVINDSGDAFNFAYYGLPSNTSVDFHGNASFTGTIYAPSADFALGGGGNNSYDFVGASVSKTVTMNGHFNFHYDENLRRVGPSRGWIPTSWTERSTTD